MIRLFLVLVPVAAAFGAEKKNSAISNGVLVWNFKDSPSTSTFDMPFAFQNFSVIENILFLNEVEECHTKYPKIDDITFYKHVYCSLKNEKYTTSTGISCNITKPLIKIIQKKLNDFDVFRNITNMNESCWENNFRPKRNSLDSDLLPGVEMMREIPKEVDKRYIYLGPTRFPITTDIHNRLFRVNEGPIDANEAANKKQPAADQAKKKQRPKKKPKQKLKPIRVSPKNFFQFLKLFKLRKLRQSNDENNLINIKTFRNLNETNNLFYEIEENTFFHFKVLETLFNYVQQYNKYIEEKRSKPLLGREKTGIVDMKGENTEDGKEEEKKQMDGEQKIEMQEKEIEGEKKIEIEEEEEEEEVRDSKIQSSLKNSYRAGLPALYYTLSWEDGTKVV